MGRNWVRFLFACTRRSFDKIKIFSVSYSNYLVETNSSLPSKSQEVTDGVKTGDNREENEQCDSLSVASWIIAERELLK